MKEVEKKGLKLLTRESEAFEEAFGDFIDRREYDCVQNVLLDMIRTSFKAGWEAANGAPLKSQPVFEVIRNRNA